MARKGGMKSNVFVKPTAQNHACMSFGMARKGGMKSNSFGRLLIFASIIFACGCQNENACFEGNYDYFSPDVKFVEVGADTLVFPEAYAPFFSVYDSLIFFFNTEKGSVHIDVYNIDTGNPIGRFYPRGHGHEEYVAISCISNFINESDELKALLTAPNEQKLLLWNISKSIDSCKTVTEQALPYKWQVGHYAPSSKVVLMGSDRMMAYYPSVPLLGTDEPSLPFFEICNIPSCKVADKIQSFKVSLKYKEKQQITSDRFFDTSFCLKPDGTKFVQSMYWLPQINIVDLQTKKNNWYRMKGEYDFSVLKTDMSSAKYYYHRVQANDEYIFALWYGEKWTSIGRDTSYDVLHVFDWNGRLLKAIKLSSPVNEIFLDTKRNILYGSQGDTEHIYAYPIDGIGLSEN